MCSAQKADLPSAAIRSAISRLLGLPAASLERIGGGRNSRVYRVTLQNNEVYAAKVYFRRSPGDRDRLEAQFSGLRFLWDNGIHDVPRPIAADRSAGCAVYEYIDGRAIPPEAVTPADIDAAAAFLGGLRRLVSAPGSGSLPEAAEACFSLKAIADNIAGRLDRLTALPAKSAPYAALRKFLEEQLMPSFDEIFEFSRAELAKMGMSSDVDLPAPDRTLNPSDFGFHNALRRPDGRIAFLDFEYFGWDDPAKMIADFLLHPGMELGGNLKQRFFAGVLAHFGQILDNRVRIVYPLFGIKWCVILLNEFVPELLARREFAASQDVNKVELQTAQLAKARRMLSRVMSEYEHFPYHS